MSRIDELIDRLCPEGIAFKTLGELGELVRGNGLPKADFTDSGVGAIHYGQIYTYYGTWTTRTLSYVAPDTAARLAKVDPGDVIITNTSENLEDVGKAVAWLGSEQIVTGGHATIFKHHQDPKFISYWLQSPSFQSQKKKLASGTKVIDVSAKQLAEVRVPVPPLEVQREIVRILDTFSELEAQLEAELEARRVQYAYLRQLLLDQVEGESVALVDLGKWQGGVTPSTVNPDYWSSDGIPWLASMDVSDTSTDEIRGRVTAIALKETSLKVIPAPSVAVVMRSNILRRRLPIGLITVDTTVNQDVRALIPRNGVDADYVYQALCADSERIRTSCVRTDGSMAAVESGSFFSWEIPLPSLEVQHRIADRLRMFDALVNDLTVGLPAEIRARRQQYEYYRDRLLTFKELPGE